MYLHDLVSLSLGKAASFLGVVSGRCKVALSIPYLLQSGRDTGAVKFEVLHVRLEKFGGMNNMKDNTSENPRTQFVTR